MELLRMKNAVSEIKFLLDEINDKLNNAEEKKPVNLKLEWEESVWQYSAAGHMHWSLDSGAAAEAETIFEEITDKNFSQIWWNDKPKNPRISINPKQEKHKENFTKAYYNQFAKHTMRKS